MFAPFKFSNQMNGIGRLKLFRRTWPEFPSSESGKKGLEFIDLLFGKLKISLGVWDKDLAHIPKSGPFIVVANHAFGDFDDLVLLKLFLKKRPDLKIFSNPVQQKAGEYLRDGGCAGIFLSGKESGYKVNSNTITGKPWGSAALQLIRDAKVPIVPVYVEGSNSLFLHLLGIKPPFLQTFELPSEVFSKKHHSIAVRIGNAIPAREQEEFHDISRFGRYIRARTYALGTSLQVKEFFVPVDVHPSEIEGIIPPVAVEDLQAEIDQLEGNYKLFEAGTFKVYCAPVAAIPKTIIEIGRLREETFRQVGEGTNKKIDLDDYDRYYRHLFIWDGEARKIVGAYRIGMGAGIFKEYGIKGFYTYSLFRISKGFHPVLESAFDLGRSFIVLEYQKKPFSLYCLWKGILHFILKHPEYRYLIGPVSISNRFSDFSRSLMTEYVRQHYFDQPLAKFISPRNPFISNTGDVDVEMLLEGAKNLRRFDKYIRDLNIEDLGMPVLLKKYLGLNGKIVAFNLDPKFNDSLDGFLVVDLKNIPPQIISGLLK